MAQCGVLRFSTEVSLLRTFLLGHFRMCYYIRGQYDTTTTKEIPENDKKWQMSSYSYTQVKLSSFFNGSNNNKSNKRVIKSLNFHQTAFSLRKFMKYKIDKEGLSEWHFPKSDSFFKRFTFWLWYGYISCWFYNLSICT